MKRVFQRKAKFFPGSSSTSKAPFDDSKRGSSDIKGRTKTSAAVLGLALSVGASGSLLTCQDERAVAAEPRTAALSSVAGELSKDPQLSPLQAHDADIAEVSVPKPVAIASQATAIQHVIREGETLWNLARQYRVSADQIAAVNGIESANALRVGQTIQIPAEAAVLASPTVHSEAIAPVSSTVANRNLAQLQVLKASATTEIDLESRSASLDVERSRSLSRLRQKREDLRTSLVDLREEDSERLATSANPVEPESSRSLKGEKPSASISEIELLKQQVTAGVGSPEPTLSIAASPTSPSLTVEGRRGSPVSHEIRVGETLASIANQYGISVKELADANGIRNPNRIFAGRVLTIPRSQLPESLAAEASEPIVVASVAETSDTVQPLGVVQPQEPRSLSPAVPQAVDVPTPPSAVADAIEVAQFKAPDSAAPEQQALTPDVVVEEPVDAAQQAIASAAALSFASEPSSAQGERNSYVENLLSEIEALSATVRSDYAPVASEEFVGAAQETTVVAASVSPALPQDIEYLQEEDAVNLEFVQETTPETEQSAAFSRQQSAVATRTEEPSALAPASSRELVAVAPLGSENYVPLNQPVTGRMVSPDLPPLPGPENYLPSGSSTFNGYLWPARGVLTSGYGWRWGRMHRGIDIAAPVGTPVYAAAPGVIEFSGWNSGGYGNMVDIRHPDGSKTRYAHNSRNLVRVGQQVEQGQQIALMGSTGYSTGPHVHFEVHLPQQGTVNPVAYLPAR